MCSKRCNSNDAISVFEILARELRATLLSNLSSRGLRGLTAGPDCGARGRRGPAGSCPAPPDWRPPRGLRGLAGPFPAPPDWRPPRGLRGLAAVPAGGGRAWPGFETTRRAKLAARTASGRAAAHGHTKQTGTNRCSSRQPEIWRHVTQKVVAPRKTWGPPLMRSLS